MPSSCSDAFGLSKPVHKLRQRHQLLDYTSNKPGLTWELQSKDFQTYQSAAAAKGWAGLNTSIFYEGALRRVGLSDFATRNRKEQKQFVRDYRIKLLGGRLRTLNDREPEPCGVLKVEFPRIFDADTLYDKDDKEFLVACSEVLAQELRRYRQFYDGTWFKHRRVREGEGVSSPDQRGDKNMPF